MSKELIKTLMLTSTHQLSARQLIELEELKLLCLKKDGNVPNLYQHILSQMRTLPSALLCYKNNQLIAFLSAFFFFEDAVEISLLVAPDERRQGIARQLIRSIKPLIETYNFPNLIFSSPAHLNDGWMPGLGFTYLHSEYHMIRENLTPLLPFESPSSIRCMEEGDIPALIRLDEVCFFKQSEEGAQRFQYLLQDRNYQIFVLIKNGHLVAKAHLRWEADGASLSDIAVSPELQGKGLATSLIAHCINTVLSEGKSNISLDVETKNERALNLYTRLGFLNKNSCDYWKIPLNKVN